MFPLKSINQIALVVRDLDEAMRRYWNDLGVGPWRVYTYQAPLVKDMTYRGRRQDYRMRLALAPLSDVTIELIQPLSDSIYTEHLQRKGEGLHHVGVTVPSLQEAVLSAAKLGFRVIQSGRGYGRGGDGGYAYLDTEDYLGMVVELIEATAERPVPEQVYPSSTVVDPSR